MPDKLLKEEEEEEDKYGGDEIKNMIDMVQAGLDDEDDDEEPRQLSQQTLELLISLYLTQYLNKCTPIKKTRENVVLLLTDWKHNRQEIFRSYIRMAPEAFDALIEALSTHSVFTNESNFVQMPVEHQFVIALYQFGHYGNAVSTVKVALWAGVGFGTVEVVTYRVLQAVLDVKFHEATVYPPTSVQKERAKEWTEAWSCYEWRKGILGVDGTLCPIYAWPAHFGNSWFDRKSNYSMSVTVSATKQCSSSHS
ncbi:hypothetical protein AAF712_016560 [Marasmius tenuissimus]|uniref:Uncharacterized protein n=1 Tax=Marasmius tenuissimus TaxID=585030 RepID=A0ABR2Z6B9_9AGAR